MDAVSGVCAKTGAEKRSATAMRALVVMTVRIPRGGATSTVPIAKILSGPLIWWTSGIRRMLTLQPSLFDPEMKRIVTLAGALAMSACTKGEKTASDTARASAGGPVHIVAGTKIAFPHAGPAGEWQMPAGDYSSSRFSDLKEITAANAGNLHASWTFSTGVLRGHEGQPLVIDNTMYIITPYPNVAYALDLKQPGQPTKWKFRPENAQQAAGRACCDVCLLYTSPSP